MTDNYFDQFDAPASPAVGNGGGNFFDQFDAPAPAAPPPETAGRIAGLTARAAISGAAGVPDTMLKLASPVQSAGQAALPIAHAIRQKLGWDAPDPAPPAGQPKTPAQTAPVEKKPSLDDFVHPDHWSDAAKYFADKLLGTPQPATPGERIYSKAVEAVPSAVLAPDAPVMGALSAAAGGGTSQAVAEAGGSPLQQTLAGLAAGSVPAAVSGVAQAGRAMIRNEGRHGRPTCRCCRERNAAHRGAGDGLQVPAAH
jgi:hypothetical protein